MDNALPTKLPTPEFYLSRVDKYIIEALNPKFLVKVKFKP
jgi:hypothetical protein